MQNFRAFERVSTENAVEMAVESRDRKQFLKIRIKKFANLYSIDLVKRLKKTWPNYEFIWLGGSDILDNLHHWKQFKKLSKLIEFAIFARQTKTTTKPTMARRKPAFLLQKKIRNFPQFEQIRRAESDFFYFSKKPLKTLPKISLFSTPLCSISSSEIRKLSAQKQK
jgi:nicotinic acid mononucleotide adenylyltransferase